MATEPLNPTIGDTYVTDDGEPRKFFAPGRWDTDYAALGADIVSAEPQAPSSLQDMFDGTGGTTSTGQTYFEHMQASQRNQILWTCRETGLTSAVIIAMAQAIDPAITPFIPIQSIEDTVWGVMQPADELVPGTQYLISILDGGTPLLGFHVTAEAGAAAGPYSYDDEPASFDRLFGNVRNSGGTNFPGGVFQPTVTGTYRFTQELGISGNEVWANLGTSSGGSQILNNNGLRLNDARESSTQSVSLTAGQNYWVTTQAGGSTGRSSIRIKIELSNYVRKAVFSGDVEMPTSMHITAASGNQTGNGFTSNGVYRSNNTGPLNNTGFGNWTWRVKATRFGDYIQHQYWNDTGNIAFRESFNGGTSWTGWAA